MCTRLIEESESGLALDSDSGLHSASDSESARRAMESALESDFHLASDSAPVPDSASGSEPAMEFDSASASAQPDSQSELHSARSPERLPQYLLPPACVDFVFLVQHLSTV